MTRLVRLDTPEPCTLCGEPALFGEVDEYGDVFPFHDLCSARADRMADDAAELLGERLGGAKVSDEAWDEVIAQLRKVRAAVRGRVDANGDPDDEDFSAAAEGRVRPGARRAGRPGPSDSGGAGPDEHGAAG